jgi:UDP-N-acetylmuramyl pentapeptide phosphotransferase/UDP-N-acetylglucosamine-1-phosphate transferase
MPGYLVSAALLIAAIYLYFRLAEKYRIVDLPNERSSHMGVTIRGGGVIFPLAAFLWFLFSGFELPWLILGVLLIAVISFLDDLMPMSFFLRIMVQMTAVTLMFWQANVFRLHWPYLFAAYILAIGWINAFNFMDGINGITPLYSLVSLGTLWWVNQSVHFAPDGLIVLMIISTLIFSWFNMRKKALCFAGDVGSISMAFIIAFFTAALMNKTDMVVYMMFFSLYGIDTVITILYRIDKNENIFLPHRTHLYQYLANEMKWSHLAVSGLYACIQLVVNIATLFLLGKGLMTRPVFIAFLALLTLIYLGARLRVIQLIRKRTTANAVSGQQRTQ